MRIFITTLVLIGFLTNLQAQETPKEPEGKLPGVVLIDLAYGMQQPEGDMKKDFFYNFNLGARVGYLLPSNWLFSLNGELIFSDRVKTDVLAPLRVENGGLLELTGIVGLAPPLGQRGFAVTAHAGRLFDLGKQPRRHSLEVRLGGGYLQHWIRIRLLNRTEDLPQLDGDYKKGYDRMTSGLALQQYVGYRYMSKSKLINVFIGLDFTEGFTKNRRYWNYDTREADTKPHTDILLGFRAGFTVAFYTYSVDTRTDEIDFY